MCTQQREGCKSATRSDTRDLIVRQLTAGCAEAVWSEQEADTGSLWIVYSVQSLHEPAELHAYSNTTHHPALPGSIVRSRSAPSQLIQPAT